MCTSRHYLPLAAVQDRPVRGAGRDFIAPGLEAHAAHQNSFLLHLQVSTTRVKYQGDMQVILSHSANDTIFQKGTVGVRTPLDHSLPVCFEFPVLQLLNV